MNKKVKDALETMCNAIKDFKKIVTEELKKCGKELPLDNGYGEEEPLVVNTTDDNCCGITYELDKARYDATHDCVEFHAVAINYGDVDEWLPYYYLNSEDTYAMENIIWED